MLPYKSRASGRKGLSRARLTVMKEMFFCGAFFRDGVLLWGIPLRCWGDALPACYCWLWFPMPVTGRSGLHRGLSAGDRWVPSSGWRLGEAAVRRNRRKRRGRAELGPRRGAASYQRLQWWSQFRTTPLQTAGQSKETFGTIIINYFCSIKVAFCGDKWNLPGAQYFRLVGK